MLILGNVFKYTGFELWRIFQLDNFKQWTHITYFCLKHYMIVDTRYQDMMYIYWQKIISKFDIWRLASTGFTQQIYCRWIFQTFCSPLTRPHCIAFTCTIWELWKNCFETYFAMEYKNSYPIIWLLISIYGAEILWNFPGKT